MLQRLLALTLAAALAAGMLAATAPRPVAADDCQTFPETGKQICGRFLAYWQANGGLAQQGLPLTSEFAEVNATDGKVYLTQYFERARFEYHPENAAPYDVLLGLVGREQFQARYPAGVAKALPDSGPNRRCFQQTGFCVNDRFIAYWDAHGGLAQQGLPISPLFTEKNPTDGQEYTTQYFERARFEYHPENEEPYAVLLGLLGREQLLNRYAGTQPATLTEVYSTDFVQPFPGATKAVGSAAATYQATGSGRLRIAGSGSVALATTGVSGGAAIQDLRIEASVIQLGSGDSSFGLSCRNRADGSLLKAIVGGGRVVFATIFPAGSPFSGNIILDQPLPGGILAPIGQPNQLRLDCVGATMALTLNGARLAEVSRLQPASGGFGLEANPVNDGAVAYDRLVVTAVTPLP